MIHATTVRRERAAEDRVPGTRRRPSARIEEFDALRGLAILCVIWLHAYFDPWATVPRTELLALHLAQLVANSAVPFFLFMSGFLATRDRQDTFATAMRGRVRRVAIPALFWMSAALLAEAWWAGALSPGLVRAFVLFDIEGQFYYVFVLLVLAAMLYPLRFLDERALGYATGIAFVASIAMIAWYESHPLSGLWWTIAYRNPLVWVFAYAFGVYVGRTRGHVEFGPRATSLALGAMLLAALAYFGMGEFGDGYPNSYFGVTVFVFAAGGFIVYPAAVRALGRTATGRIVLAPGRALAPYAFGIYLVHQPYFIGALSTWAIEVTSFEANYLVHISSLFVIGGIASIAFVVAVDKVFPRFSALLLGVEPPRPTLAPVLRAISRYREAA